MSQPFSWEKDYFAANAWQGNFNSLDELNNNLDDLFNKFRQRIAKEIEANCGFIQFCAFGDCTCGTAADIARGGKS